MVHQITKSVIDSEFAKWAAGNVILVELDYPRRTPQALEVKKQNNELQQAFGIQGFPIYFANGVDTEGKVNFEGLGSTGYVAGGPEAWLAIANGILKRIISI
jgi:protein disulfide-isomerase